MSLFLRRSSGVRFLQFSYEAILGRGSKGHLSSCLLVLNCRSEKKLCVSRCERLNHQRSLSYNKEQKQPEGMYRTVYCAEVAEQHVNTSQLFSGWVKFIRGMSKSSAGFLVLTDHTGDLQFLLTSNGFNWKEVTVQSAMTLRGKVMRRPEQDVNKEMVSGQFEVHVEQVLFCNIASPLPFNVSKPQSAVREDVRLQYRYLDLRRPQMQHMLRMRSSTIHKMRKFLVETLNFVEVETPTLFRSSPGGAREFLVPSQQPGHFYALAQSPQQLKQLLMVGMVDRYFQLAKCYRDECQFADRQLEFTQLDMEVSFESKGFIQNTIEQLIMDSWPSHLQPCPELPFVHMTYNQVMEEFGSDKPDLRYGDVKLVQVTEFVPKLKSDAINASLQRGYPAYALLLKQAQVLSRSAIHKAIQTVEKELRWMVSSVNVGQHGEWHQHVFKNASRNAKDALNSLLKCENGDVMFLCAGPKELACSMLGRLRTRLIQKLAEMSSLYKRDAEDFRFLWVEDFPLFELRYEEGTLGKPSWVATHHPFTAPHADDLQYLDSDPARVRGQHFDLVLNGHEIGGGSMRISDPQVQTKVLDQILKLDCSNFQYLIDALAYGAPVHGGIALGLDRYFAVLLGKDNIREVLAFPKSSRTGACLMSDSPSKIDAQYLKDTYSITSTVTRGD